MATPLVIWRFSDGKAGHDNQSRGLVQALARLRSVEAVTLEPVSPTAALAILLGHRRSAWGEQPNPDVLLGAGHRTHLSLLAARRMRGGKAVVLMRPTLPLHLFDLCLIPEHDAPPLRSNVLITCGALNRIQPSSSAESDQGLLLIGGPSAHFGWDDEMLYRQIAMIVADSLMMHWTLTTSRRTPSSFLEGLQITSDQELTVVPVTQTDPDWLPTQLAKTRLVWVTADSVSMVYEALTAGAAVGVLEIPQRRTGRISRGLDRLAVEGRVTFFTNWQQSRQLGRPTQPFNEAERCARRIIERWFA